MNIFLRNSVFNDENLKYIYYEVLNSFYNNIVSFIKFSFDFVVSNI